MEQIPFNTLAHQHDASIDEAVLSVLRNSWFIQGTRLAEFESQFAEFTGVKHCVGTGNGHDALVLALRALGLGTQQPFDSSQTQTSRVTSHQLQTKQSATANASSAIKSGQEAPGINTLSAASARDAGPDEVLVPANTYIATWLAVSNAGCIPVPVEPDPATLNINPRLIAAHITPRTKAIIPVHLYGNPCDMGAIMALADKYELKVIEDNAQGHGASLLTSGFSTRERNIPGSDLPDSKMPAAYMNSPAPQEFNSSGDVSNASRFTGSFGHANATSFYPTKNLGALGDGGAVTTMDDDVARRIRMLRNYGFASRDVCEEVGVNSRLDEMQAAVLSLKLKRLGEWNEQRRAIAHAYNVALKGIGDIILPVPTKGGTHVYHLYVIRTSQRDRLREHLAARGIQTMIHYPIPPHLQKAYRHLGYREGSFPITEKMCTEMLSLPLWIGMSDGQVLRICEEVRRYFG